MNPLAVVLIDAVLTISILSLFVIYPIVVGVILLCLIIFPIGCLIVEKIEAGKRHVIAENKKILAAKTRMMGVIS